MNDEYAMGKGGTYMTNLRGSCLAKDLLINIGLMHWGTIVLEMGSGKSITLAPAFAEMKRPDREAGQIETNRELALPADCTTEVRR